MGSMSAMNSIDRVLAAHGDEIRSDFKDQAPPSIQHQLKTVVLSNNTYGIEVEWQFQDGSTLQGPSIDIDDLADRYPDCDVGY